MESYDKPFYSHFIAEQVSIGFYTNDHKLIPNHDSASDLFLLQENQASYHSFIVENKEYELQLPVLKKKFPRRFPQSRKLEWMWT